MKSFVTHAVVGGLAALLTLSIPARGEAADTGCLGETFKVVIEHKSHVSKLLNEVGGESPKGFPNTADKDFTVKGAFVRELRDGRQRWVSRRVEWSGTYFDVEPACARIDCDAGGGPLELGPSDGGADSLSPEQRDQIIWHCKPIAKFGNCFRFNVGYPSPLPFPSIRGTRDTLRLGTYYTTVDRDGTRYSEIVEQRGDERLTITAEPAEIEPNAREECVSKLSKGSHCPGEAATRLTITATCSGVPLPDRNVGVRIDVLPRSGGHHHLTNRPRGKLAAGDTVQDCGKETGTDPENMADVSCLTVKTDADGKATVEFKSPLTGSIDNANYGSYYSGIAGDYSITAKDSQFTEVRAGTTVRVRVAKLEQASALQDQTVEDPLEHPDGKDRLKNILVFEGARAAHPRGSYATDGTLSAFVKLAEEFHKAQHDHNSILRNCAKPPWNVIPLSANDIALHAGGVFDWHLTWRPSHQTHNKGEGGDFNRFGASDADSWTVQRTDCDGPSVTTVIPLIWYTQVLLDLGKNHGHWDCADLGAGEYFSQGSCAKGEIPPLGQMGGDEGALIGFMGFIPQHEGYYPPDLHLHVED